MRRFLMSAASLVVLAGPILLAIPALAQPGNDRDRGHGGQPRQEHAPPSQGPQGAMAPQQRSTPFNRSHDVNRPATPMVAPPVQPQAPQFQGRQDRSFRQQPTLAQPQAQPGFQNRGDRGANDAREGGRDRRSFDNRPGTGFNNNNRPENRYDNRFGNRSDNRGGNRAGQGFNGPRRDFSTYRDYHQSFNARHRFHAEPYRRPHGWYQRRWTFGEILPRLFWAPDYWLDDYARYDLPPPPFGAIWVRDGFDALLIDRDTGEIISIAYDVFY